MAPTQIIQNTGGNCVVTVNGTPEVGATLWSQPYSGASAQQWITAQYPGDDPSNTGGVVCVIYYGGSTASPSLVVTAPSQAGQPVTLQKFQMGNLNQLWAYDGAGTTSTFLNLGNAYMLDLYHGQCNGGQIQTYQPNNTQAQSWKTTSVAEAAARTVSVSEAGALESAGA